MVAIFAGHNPDAQHGGKIDPGAPGLDGRQEANMTVELRDKIIEHLTRLKAHWVKDDDKDGLAAVLGKVKTGTGSVICDIHFNAFTDPMANGTEVIIPTRFSREEFSVAAQLVDAAVKHLGVKARVSKGGKAGVKTEAESNRGSLAVMRKEGINVLIEVCFITNRSDLQRYLKGMDAYAQAVANILIEADALLT